MTRPRQALQLKRRWRGVLNLNPRRSNRKRITCNRSILPRHRAAHLHIHRRRRPSLHLHRHQLPIWSYQQSQKNRTSISRHIRGIIGRAVGPSTTCLRIAIISKTRFINWRAACCRTPKRRERTDCAQIAPEEITKTNNFFLIFY